MSANVFPSRRYNRNFDRDGDGKGGEGGGRVRHGLITNRYNRILCRCLDLKNKESE